MDSETFSLVTIQKSAGTMTKNRFPHTGRHARAGVSNSKTSSAGFSRRDTLHAGLLSLAGMTLADSLRASETASGNASADAVLFVNLGGGPALLLVGDVYREIVAAAEVPMRDQAIQITA